MIYPQLCCFVFLFLLNNVYMGSLIPMRSARARFIYQSIYSHAFHRHFLGKFPSISMKSCLWLCQNNDYCRTATYRPSEQQCYLYEELSYVGTISSTTDGSIVIAFNLCSIDNNINVEPTSICFGLKGKSAPMQTVINGLQLVQSYTGILSVGFVLTPSEIWMPVIGSPLINIYSYDNYSITRSVSTNKGFGYFDLDSQMQYIIAYGSNGIYLSQFNQTFNNGASYWTPCISVTGVIIAFPVSATTIHVFNQTNGNLIYTITGSMNLSSIDFRKLACTVLNQTLYIGSNSAIQKVSIAPPGGTQILTSIFNYTTNNPGFITTDTSGRLYSSCIDCPLVNKTVITTIDGILLAQWPQKLAFAQAKASKYKYYFVTSTLDNNISFYEY